MERLLGSAKKGYNGHEKKEWKKKHSSYDGRRGAGTSKFHKTYASASVVNILGDYQVCWTKHTHEFRISCLNLTVTPKPALFLLFVVVLPPVPRLGIFTEPLMALSLKFDCAEMLIRNFRWCIQSQERTTEERATFNTIGKGRVPPKHLKIEFPTLNLTLTMPEMALAIVAGM